MKEKLVLLLAVLLMGGNPAWPQSAAESSFALLKSLAGEWQGMHAEGNVQRVTFRITSGGSALLQELVEADRGEEMVTMFHLNRDRLLLTHYCSAGNQPRMVATVSPDGKTIAFEFLDATNLIRSMEGHMNRLVVRLLAHDHHTEEWTFAGPDGKQTRDLVDFHRVGS